MNYMATHNFDNILPKIIKITFSFTEFAPACKKLVHSIYSFLKYSHFKSPITTLTWKFFDQLLIYVNLYQHAKNQAISFICSGDMID